MFKARVYPIPAEGETRIQLSYSEIITAEHDIVRYVYPLDTERFSHHPIEEVTLSVDIHSAVPIANVYSSSHKISVRKEGKNRARASFEQSEVKPDKDFVLYFSLSHDDVGLSFLNCEGPEDNYFMLLASPSYVSKKEKVIEKNLVFVLDSSGSMAGKKIIQAKEAVRFVVNNLHEKDRFSIIDFDDGVEMY